MPVNYRTGRPKDATKRAAITSAAHDLFLSQPFEAVTMEAVAAQAGVSKMTVYSHFQDKETLFESVVMSISDRMVAASADPAFDSLNLRDRLHAIGLSFLGIILTPGLSNLTRSLFAATNGNLALAKRLYDAGPGRTRGVLVDIIADAVRRGELVTDEWETAADDLMGLWDGGKCIKLLSGIENIVTPDEIKRQTGRCVDVFLRAYQNVGPDGLSSAASGAKR